MKHDIHQTPAEIVVGIFHNLWVAGAFLIPSVPTYKDPITAVIAFDFGLLTFSLSRGSNSIFRALLFVGIAWPIGFIYYGMARP